MPKRRNIELTSEEKKKLEYHRDHDKEPYVRERCAALIKIAEGKSAHWVSQYGLFKKRDPDTIYSWLTIYETEGIEGLIAKRHGGSRRRGL